MDPWLMDPDWLPREQHQERQQQFMPYVPANVYPENNHQAYHVPQQFAPQHASGGQHYRGQAPPANSHRAETTELGKALDMASERVGTPEMNQRFKQELRTGLSIAKCSTNKEVQKMGDKMREYTWHLEASVFQGSLTSLRKVKGVFAILRGEDSGGLRTGALLQCLLTQRCQLALHEAVSAMETANENAKYSEQRLYTLLQEAEITQETFSVALVQKVEEIKQTSRSKGRFQSTERFFEGAGAVTAATGGVAGGFAGAGMVAFGISTAALLDIAGGCGAATVLFTFVALYAYCKRVKAKGKVRRKKYEEKEIQKAVEKITSIVAALYGIEAVLMCVLAELDVILKELVVYTADAARGVEPTGLNVLVRQADWLYGRCTDFERAVQFASNLVEAELNRTRI